MNTRQISFAIQGMFCANCAVKIEHALARVDGIITAHVNYATERATVMFVPGRLSTRVMVAAVQNEGFHVTLEHVILNVEGLLYTSSTQTVERILSRVDDVVQVRVQLDTQQIGLDVFSGRVNLANYKGAIAKLGLRVVDQVTPELSNQFVKRTLLISALTVLSLFSAGAHAGLYQASILHAPLVVIAIAVLVVYGIGKPFFYQAYEMGLQGELDASVLLALAISVSLFGGLVVALASPSTWLTDSGFVFAVLLTAGWFIGRAVSVWVLPRFPNRSLAHVPVAQVQINATSNGNHF